MVDDWYSYFEAAVYSRLWCLANATGNNWVYPSEQQIATDLRISERSVRNALNTLEENWLIFVYRRGVKRRNNYEIADLDLYPSKDF